MRPFERHAPELDACREQARTGPCLVWGIAARDPDFSDHHVFYEDDDAIASLNRWPAQRGYTPAAPKRRGEQVTGDFPAEEYPALQRVVRRAAEAVREEVGAGRACILSPGSSGGDAHVREHVVPLSPGAPNKEQQFAALAARIGRRKEGP